jgi:hypothetical protein
MTSGPASTSAVGTPRPTSASAADDHRPPGAGVDRRAQVEAVLQDRQAVDARQVDAGDRRPQRLGAGGDHQHVPRLVAGPPGVEVAHPHPPRPQVDRLDLVPDAGVDALLGELLRGAGDQGPPVLHDVARVVGEAAGRVGGVPAALEGDDLQVVGVAPLARLGGGAHAGGVPPDHHHARARAHARTFAPTDWSLLTKSS